MSRDTHSLHDPMEDPDFDSAEVIPFKMDPKEPEGTDWLSVLDVGTIVLIKRKNSNPVVFTEVHVVSKGTLGINLRTMLINLDSYYEWVNPVEYCKAMDLVEILREPGEPNNEQESV